MRRSFRYFPSLLVLLATLLGACNTAAPPLELQALASTDVAPGVAFLPPVGQEVDTTSFYASAQVRIDIHRLDGSDVGVDPILTFSTVDGSVRVEDEFYLALWRVSATLKDEPPTLRAVRVLAWATDFEPGSQLDEGVGCIETDPTKGCLVGTIDAELRRSRKQRGTTGALDLTRTRTLPIKLFIPGAAHEPASITEINRLAEPNAPFEATGPNCTVDEFSMPGQGLNALGSGLNALGSGLNALGSKGGLFLLGRGTMSGAPSIRLMQPAEAGVLASDLAGTGTLAQSAAILVVDDFGLNETTWRPIFEVGSDLLWPSPSLSAPELGVLVEGQAFSHGALVLHQIEQMVVAAGFDVKVTPEEWPEFQVFHRSGDDPKQYLVVAAVDTAGFDTDMIATRIQNALNALEFYNDLDPLDDVDIQRVAINMSFAIVPCSVLHDFEASGLETFEDYVAELGADNAIAADFYDELTRLLITPLSPADERNEDPLLTQIERCGDLELASNLTPQDVFAPIDPYEPQWPGDLSWRALVEWPEEFPSAEIPTWECPAGASVVYVASSGNFGLDYPMYPAAWPLVVGVSSQDAAATGFTTVKSSFSNSGEVMAPGALYELGRSSAGDPERVIAYAGTSFSAPVVSLFTALDLMLSSPTCGLHNTSRLTYFVDDGNEPLADAVTPSCLP